MKTVSLSALYFLVSPSSNVTVPFKRAQVISPLYFWTRKIRKLISDAVCVLTEVCIFIQTC